MEHETATLSDMAEAVRDADEQEVWNQFGHAIQREVIDAEPDDTKAVVMSLTVSTDLFAHDGRLTITPAITWAVDDVDGTREKLKDNGDAVVVWKSSAPVVDDIQRKVADALERADS